MTCCEVISYSGTGKVTCTGNLGQIMQESIEVIISIVKNKYKYNFSKTDLHFHYLSADIKKDGPSAGLASIICLLSLMEKKKIANDIAFTGELSLNGNILKIGGLKEKLIGAYNRGIKTVYIPKSNQEDLKELPEVVKNSIEVNLVSNIDDLYTKLFK